MTWLVVKYLLTAGVVVLVSEMAKRSDKLGGLIAVRKNSQSRLVVVVTF